MTAYLLSRLRRGRWRAATIAAGVALGTALYVAVSLLGTAFRDAAAAPLRDVGADVVLTKPGKGQPALRGITQPEGRGTFTTTDLAKVTKTDQVEATAGSLTLWDFGPRQTLVVTGTDPTRRDVGPSKLLAENIVEGHPIHPDDQAAAVADLHYAKFYNVKVGSTVTIGNKPFTIVGILETTEGSQAAAANLYIPLKQAQALAGTDKDTINEIHVRLTNASNTDKVVATLDEQLGGISAVTEDSLVRVFGAVGRVTAKFSTLAALVGILGGVLLAWLAMQAMVQERTREIGILKAVGWRTRDVVRLMRTEALALSAVGAALGLVLGIAVAAGFAAVPLPAEVSRDMPPMAGMPATETKVELTIDPLTLLTAAAAAILAGTLAGALTARRAAKIRPAHNLRAL